MSLSDLAKYSMTRSLARSLRQLSFLFKFTMLTSDHSSVNYARLVSRTSLVFFTARRVCIAQTMARCLSVCLSVRLYVCLLHASIESKRLYISSIFSPSGSPTILVFSHQTGWQYSDRDPIWQMIPDRAIVTMEDE